MSGERVAQEFDSGARGTLGVIDFSDLGFRPVRLFWIHSVEQSIVRAQHWHRRDHQYLLCLTGKLSVYRENSDGSGLAELSQGEGISLPAETWVELKEFSNDATALVLSSQAYDPNDCYSDYQAFRKEFIETVSGLDVPKNVVTQGQHQSKVRHSVHE